MRAVRQTFEHLVIILVVLFLCLAILFAIPAVRIWVFDNAPAAMAGMAGGEATSSILSGVDPQLLTNAINDDKTREELISLWTRSIPEMDPAALADMGNQLLSDPNTSALLVNTMASLNPEAVADLSNALLSDSAVSEHVLALLPKLDPRKVSDLTNALMASDATAQLVRGLLENLDGESTAALVNAILAEDATATAATEMMANLDATKLCDLINTVLAEADKSDSKLANFVNAMIGATDGKQISVLVDKILANVDDEGRSVIASKLNDLMGNLNDSQFRDFLFEVLDQPETSAFIADALGTVRPGTPTFNMMEQLLTPGQGLHKVLFGELGTNDALLDFIWNEQKVCRAFCNGNETLDESVVRWGAVVRGTLTYQFVQIFGEQLGRQLADVLVPLADTYITPLIAGYWSAYFSKNMQETSQVVRVVDLVFTDQPPWTLPNGAAWADKYGVPADTYKNPMLIPKPEEEWPQYVEK